MDLLLALQSGRRRGAGKAGGVSGTGNSLGRRGRRGLIRRRRRTSMGKRSWGRKKEKKEEG